MIRKATKLILVDFDNLPGYNKQCDRIQKQF